MIAVVFTKPSTEIRVSIRERLGRFRPFDLQAITVIDIRGFVWTGMHLNRQR